MTARHHTTRPARGALALATFALCLFPARVQADAGGAHLRETTPASGCMAVEFETVFIDYVTADDGAYYARHTLIARNNTSGDLTVLPNNPGPDGQVSFEVPAGGEASTVVYSGESPYVSEEWIREAPTRSTDSTFVSGVSFFAASDGVLLDRVPGCDIAPNHGQDPATSVMGNSWVIAYRLPGRGPVVDPEMPRGQLELAPGQTEIVDVLDGIPSFTAPIDPDSLRVIDDGTLTVTPTEDGELSLTAPADTPPGLVRVELEVCTVDNWCSPFRWDVTVTAESSSEQTVPPTTPPTADTPETTETSTSLTGPLTALLIVVAFSSLVGILFWRRRRDEDEAEA